MAGVRRGVHSGDPPPRRSPIPGPVRRRLLHGAVAPVTGGDGTATGRCRRSHRDRQVRPRPWTSPTHSAARSSTSTRCSSTAAWTSAPPNCPPRSGAGSRTINSTFSTSPKPRPSPAIRVPRRADIEAILARGRVPGHRRRVDDVRPGVARRVAVPRHRPAGPGQVGGRAGSGRARSRARGARRADPVAAATILPTDGRRMVRALEVVELTGMPFAASPPTIGDPRWDTVILGVDRETAELDDRISPPHRHRCSTAVSWTRSGRWPSTDLRDGVTARRAIGYAQVLDVSRRRVRPRPGPRTDVHRDPPLRAPSAVVVPAGSAHPLARRQRPEAHRVRAACRAGRRERCDAGLSDDAGPSLTACPR